MQTVDTDFGRSLRLVPQTVRRVGEDGTAEEIMRQATASGQDVAVRGNGRSCNTQTLTTGTLLDNRRHGTAPRFVDSPDGEHLVEVPTGTTWLELETWLAGHGRAVPVLPSYLDLTVGGTLSIGGFGLGSLRHGLQIDQVERIELVDGDGRTRRCSPRENAELFRYALGGVGQVGHITTAVLRTVARTAVTRVTRVDHTGLADLVAHLPRVAADPRAEGYFGMYDRAAWYSQISLAPGADETGLATPVLPVPDYTGLLHQEVAGHLAPLLGAPTHANLWADYVLDEAGLPAFTAALEQLIAEPPLTASLISLYFLVVQRPAPATPFAFAPVLDAPVQYGIGVFASAPVADEELVAGTRRAQRRLLEVCAEAGGRPYLYGAHALDRELLHTFYGTPALGRLEELRTELALTRFSRRGFGGARP
ncbi:FAD-binding protein [Kitasatospora sp. NPDC051853]|uniref:FAD-binding protein n=1 Tax=Kitasatospora sp. NPDC051853 TaxID=3364058 RepID=UPI00379DD8FB